MPIFELLACLGLALVCGYVIHRLRRSATLSVDEGYLWYGVLRVRAGALPLRDFRSYEPGRYWWVAAFTHALGRDIGAVRLAALCFYVCAMGAALAGLRMAGMDWPSIAMCAALLAAWAYPVYKLFEPGLLLFGFLGAVLLLLDPVPMHAGIAGSIVGLAAVFGLNYGLYLGVGMAAVAIAVIAKAPAIDPVALIVSGLAGGLLGSAPLWITMLASPAFSSTLFERRVQAILQRGTTNLPLQVPWPWRPIPEAWRKHGPAARAFGSVSYLAMPVLGFGSLLALALWPWNQVEARAAYLAAGALVAAAQHHAFSRADLLHLCQVMPLVAICALALCGPAWSGVLLPAVVLGAGATSMPLRRLKRLLRRRRGAAGPASPALSEHDQQLVDVLRQLRAAHLQPGETLLALPQLASLYPLLGVESPVYDNYCVYPASDRDQTRMLREIEHSGVRLAVIQEHALDGREDLRFSRTHPRVWAHLHRHFEKLPRIETLPDVHLFLRGRTVRPAAEDEDAATVAR